MSRWDRIVWVVIMVAVVLGAEAIEEGVRQHNIVTGLVLGVVALGCVGLWRLVRWLELRH